MAWSAIPTFTSGNVLTAAQQNILGGNLAETAPALATAAGQYPVSTGANSLAMRTTYRNTQLAADTTTSTSYADIAASIGPTISGIVAGTTCLVLMQAKVQHGTALGNSLMSVNVTGASTIAPDDEYALAHAPGAATGFMQCTFAILFVNNDGWLPGTSAIQAKYRVNTGTGTFDKRRLTAIPF